MDSDYKDILNKRTKQYSCSFMSNTKWRKVFLLIKNNEIDFRFNTIWNGPETVRETLSNCSEDAISSEYLKDGAVFGGPLIYKEILYVDIFKVEEHKSAKTGAIFLDETKFNKFQIEFNNMGKFNVIEFERHMRITGYQ